MAYESPWYDTDPVACANAGGRSVVHQAMCETESPWVSATAHPRKTGWGSHLDTVAYRRPMWIENGSLCLTRELPTTHPPALAVPDWLVQWYPGAVLRDGHQSVLSSVFIGVYRWLRFWISRPNLANTIDRGGD